jgi:Dolichyl-phosphate-mannose-protein mannosyltransferase
MIVLFLLPILTGVMLVHNIWPDRDPGILVFKAFLGIGIGLGIWSLLYFLYLLWFAGQHWFIVIQLIIFILMLAITVWEERKRGWSFLPHWNFRNLTRTQGILAAISCVVLLVSLSSTISYLLRRKQGDWDAWMMFNRAARFVYRDQANWLESFSPRMDPIFHADYPLLLAMNIASGWDTLGNETPHVPMAESALFAIACAGLMVGALASVKSVGQAALGLVILWGTPVVVNEGSREMADIPLAFFILATGVLIYLYVLHKKPGLLALAGLTAGLAAWTKNEGSVIVIAAGLALVIAFIREKPLRILGAYALGLVLPLSIVLYFKFFLAPPSDVLSNGVARSIAQVLDPSRHAEILRFYWGEFLSFGRWGIPGLSIGIIPVLLIYFLLFNSGAVKKYPAAYIAGITMLVIQALGYYAIYLITPYDLTWHLSYSIERIALQIFPLVAFLVLSASQSPESVFDSNAVN